MQQSKLASKVFDCAVRLLARREHGEFELAQKLLQKGYSTEEIEEAVDRCKRLGLQSDARFAESVCRARIHQGYGPLRIRKELQSKQIDSEHIENVLQLEDDNWLEYAQDVWQKKYGGLCVGSYVDRQKQKQFLHYRGFSSETISDIFASQNEMLADPR